MTNNLGRFRISVTDDPDAAGRPRRRAASARSWPSPASGGRPRRSRRSSPTGGRPCPSGRRRTTRIEALWKDHPAGATTLVLQARAEPRTTSVLKRGDFLKPASRSSPGVPAFLHPLPPDAAPDRLTFARWLVDRESPTTARAFVNRVWQAYFGTGLVATPEDFGTQAEPPSHPELLDWLAFEFMDQGWSIKDLHRLIVTSATYRQSSKVDARAAGEGPVQPAPGPRARGCGSRARSSATSSSPPAAC